MTRTLLLIALALTAVANAVVSTMGEAMGWHIALGAASLICLTGIALTYRRRGSGQRHHG